MMSKAHATRLPQKSMKYITYRYYFNIIIMATLRQESLRLLPAVLLGIMVKKYTELSGLSRKPGTFYPGSRAHDWACGASNQAGQRPVLPAEAPGPVTCGEIGQITTPCAVWI